MAKYIDVEPLMNGGWQLQRYNSGNGYVNQEHASLKDIPPADVWPVAEILNAVDEAIIFLNNASHQMPYHVYSALYDLIYEICPNCGADMSGGDAE